MDYLHPAGGADKTRLHRKFDLHLEPDDDQPLPTWPEAVVQAKRTAAFYKKQASAARGAAHRATMNAQAAVHKGQAQLAISSTISARCVRLRPTRSSL
jgi:hypothetical protein